MELKKITDASGKSLTVLEYQGRLFPPFSPDSIRGIETFKARPDDVIVCAYPKCGTHWMCEIVRVLQAGTTDVPPDNDLAGMIEMRVPDELEKLTSPRTLNIHAHFEFMPKEIFKQKSKIIYITRDPRDAAVSFYNHHIKMSHFNHYEGAWKDYLPLFLEGKCTDGKGEVRKIANFLGVPFTEDFLDQVIAKCSFDSMKQVKIPVMCRKGKTGDWKNWFTVAESELFNSLFEREMKGTQAYNLYSLSREK